jgi:hypothetical protein
MKHISTFESFLNESSISIDTTPYRTTHAKEPKGNGKWAFEINGETVFVPNAMSYADALKWAKEEATKAKAVKIKVLG